MTTITAPSITDKIARRAHLKEQIERLEQEVSLINDDLVEALSFGKHEEGDWLVSIRRNQRLDTAKIEARYPVTQYPQFYKPTIDTKAVREWIAPIELEAFQSEGNPIVVVK